MKNATELSNRSSTGPVVARRALLVGGLALVGSSGCAYLMHPERRQRTTAAGPVDTTALVFDLLWLLPGLIPGIVCLAVDFGSGTIYGPPTKVTVSRRARPGTTVEVELDGGLVASGAVSHDRPAALEWTGLVDGDAVQSRGVVRVRGPRGELAEASAASILTLARTGVAAEF